LASEASARPGNPPPPIGKNLKKSDANESRYELSLSVGVARFDPKRAISLGELMAQANEAMYEQTETIRNLAVATTERQSQARTPEKASSVKVLILCLQTEELRSASHDGN
jgi:hypothetical protein